VDGTRSLVVTADDFGIGPATSQAILDLAARGLVTSTVLLVNSPHAEAAVQLWRQAGQRLELGWHPCLTLDHPVLPPERVPSLVQPDGRFRPLGGFLRRLVAGQVRTTEIKAELSAQLERFRELVGRLPSLVNSHHHVQVFPPVGRLLLDVLAAAGPMPYVRRVREPGAMLLRVPGARGKRAVLSLLGRFDARRQRRRDVPGNDWLAGVTDPPWVTDPEYLTRWLTRIPGRVVELTCHPGYHDPTLLGRDGTLTDGLLERRVHELERLRHPTFLVACRRAGFKLCAPRDLVPPHDYEEAHAA
jgi:chitin disaccharide deacetylase